jgi:O-antigen/teichoic acid export membrane protein
MPASFANLRRLSWGVADQAVSSATTFALSLLLLRYTTAAQYGLFALGFAIYLMILNFARAACSTPLLLKAGDRSERDGAAGLAILIGASTAGMIPLTALILHFEHQQLLLLLAFSMPILLLQDQARMSFLASAKPRRAFALSVVWLGVFAFSSTLALHEDATSLFALTACWIFGATASSIYALLAHGPRPSLRSLRRYTNPRADLIRSLVPEGLFYATVTQFSTFAIASTLSTAALGQVRGAQTVLGTASTIYMGLMPMVTVGARQRAHETSGLMRYTLLTAISTCSFVIFFGLAAIGMSPHWLASLFGGGIANSRHLLLPATLSLAASVWFGTSLIALRFIWRPRYTSAIRVVATTLDVGMTLVGALTFGASGALYGSAVALGVSALFAMLTLWRATHVGCRAFTSGATFGAAPTGTLDTSSSV